MKLKVKGVSYTKGERMIHCHVTMMIISGKQLTNNPDIYSIIEDEEIRKFTDSNGIIFDGTACCHKDDEWDEEKGKRIAFAKAMRQSVAFRRIICNRCMDKILNAAKRAGEVETKVNKSAVFMNKDVEYLRNKI